MTKQEDTLRIVHDYLYALAHGAPVDQWECELIARLCALALPMKYRWTRAELDAKQARAKAKAKAARRL